MNLIKDHLQPHVLLLCVAALHSDPFHAVSFIPSVCPFLASPSLQWLQQSELKDTSLVRHLFGARGTDRLYSKDFFR